MPFAIFQWLRGRTQALRPTTPSVTGHRLGAVGRSGRSTPKPTDGSKPVHSCFKITCMKTATYAIMHLTVAIAVAYALTGSWKMALAIGLVEPFVQTFAFMIHERFWNKATANAQKPAGAVDRMENAVTKTRLGKSGLA